MRAVPSRSTLNLVGDRMHGLPLGIVYITDRCNSRCVMCDYWQFGQTFMSQDRAGTLAAEFDRLDTRWVLLSGGEPLMHPEWAEIARVLSGGRRQLWLLTAGIALKKHAGTVAELCRNITVSLDAATPEKYLSIRGVDAFEDVCAGIRAVAGSGRQVSIRCTVQRRNYRQLPALIELAHQLGVHQISFLAIDVLTHVAFAHKQAIQENLALAPEDLPYFVAVLDEVSARFAGDFASGFIAESREKLRRLKQYFAALNGLAEFPPVRCNAPRFSAVYGPEGKLQPCFFIAPEQSHLQLNDPELVRLRHEIRMGERGECKTCVCSMQRGLRSFVLPVG